MFDSCDWNVDQTAAKLDSSLFGAVTQTKRNKKNTKVKSQNDTQSDTKQVKLNLKRKAEKDGQVNDLKNIKKKKEKVSSGHENTDVKLISVNANKDEKNQLRKVKRRKKKKRKPKDDAGENSGDQREKIVTNNSNIPNSDLKKNDLEQSNNVNKKKKRKRQKKKKLADNSLTKEDKNGTLDKSEAEIENRSTPGKKKRKRKKKSSIVSENVTSKKPKVLNEDETSPESKKETGQMSRKERRNKRKKKNSKKNKYAHLSLASKAERAVSESTCLPSVNESDTQQQTSESSTNQIILGNSVKEISNPKKKLDKTSSSENTNISKAKSLKKTTIKTNADLTEMGTADLNKSPQTPSKQKFNLTKLKEALSASEKKIKSVKAELAKKSEKQKEKLEKEISQSPTIAQKGKQKRKSADHEENNSEKMSKKNVQGGKVEQDSKGKKKEMFENKGQEKSLKERMQDQLNAARFRYLNEQLYTNTGSAAAEMFAEDDNAFHVYHQGYQNQVSKWPVDPLSIIIKQIKSRHTGPKTLIADMGCGSARLAQSLPGVKVHSFDFVAENDLVTACDMSDVPLEDGSVHVVVFCLSLMGTNLVDYILEANRILKPGGTMKIAEVESRFKKVGAFVSKVEKLGFEIVCKDLSNKMFYLFDFKKVKDVQDSPSNPKIELDPCIYKKR